MSDESDFSALADRVLRAIGEALDTADADVDWTLNDGVLEIDCGAGGKLIVNRHLPSREIWVAARSGGFHFTWRDGQWRDTRSGDELFASLARIIASQAGANVDWK
jgi:CyaY protein